MENLQWASSILLGLAVCWLIWQIGSLILNPRNDRPHNKFERVRREQLRRENSIYRWFEPLIEELSQSYQQSPPQKLETLQRHLIVAQEPLPWTAVDFLATKLVEGVLIGLGFLAFFTLAGYWIMGLVLGTIFGLTYVELARSSIASRATTRMQRIRMRLPFAVDTICLMMEAGSGFADSLNTVVRENREHPLGSELNDVVQQIAAGRPRSEALRGFQDRMHDDDISELVFAINKGEELGTPLTVTLRNQVEQIRLKRSQWGEKAAAEAQVKIVFPGMVIMIACLLVIVTPLIYPLILTMFGI